MRSFSSGYLVGGKGNIKPRIAIRARTPATIAKLTAGRVIPGVKDKSPTTKNSRYVKYRITMPTNTPTRYWPVSPYESMNVANRKKHSQKYALIVSIQERAGDELMISPDEV
jgi:hypothetical protein